MSIQSAKILANADVVKIIEEYITLDTHGDSFRGICPFHPDKNPSLSVSPELGIFKCFSAGCGVGGNAAKFISLYEGISYYAALGIIARKTGQGHLAPETIEEAEDVYEINSVTAALYSEVLFTKSELSKKARETLQKRRISQETAQHFGLGYSPNSWTWLTSRGLNQKMLLKAGLIKKTSVGHHRDFFKNRIIFPIYHQKFLVGFTGRTLGTAKKIPKYLNSSESDWYKKREVIYGWHHNAPSIRRSKQVVIVEGQFDVLQLYQRGITNSIAISGSHFGVKQAAFIKQNVKEALIFCDGDKAGAQVGVKLGSMLLEQGVQVEILYLKGKDPDDVARNSGRFDWEKLQTQTVSPVQFAYAQEDLESALTVASTHKNKVRLGYALRELSELSGYDEKHLEHWLAEYKRDPLGRSTSVTIKQTNLSLSEELLLLAAYRHIDIPLSKYLRQKLSKDGINLQVAKTDGFIQQLAEKEKYVSRLTLIAQVEDLEKYQDDLKAHLTLYYLKQDVKQLKRRIKRGGDDMIKNLETLEKKIKRINKIKLQLKTGREYRGKR